PPNFFFCDYSSILLKKKNPNCGGGASPPQLSFGFAAIKVNFVNFFDEDLTFEKWDSAKL
ncbi:MAG: hypothetical protein ACK5Y4_13950, partial [Pseudanabaena sp.]